MSALENLLNELSEKRASEDIYRAGYEQGMKDAIYKLVEAADNVIKEASGTGKKSGASADKSTSKSNSASKKVAPASGGMGDLRQAVANSGKSIKTTVPDYMASVMIEGKEAPNTTDSWVKYIKGTPTPGETKGMGNLRDKVDRMGNSIRPSMSTLLQQALNGNDSLMNVMSESPYYRTLFTSTFGN